MHINEIGTKIQALPDSAKREALNYIEFLLQKYAEPQKNARPFHFTWENTLKNITEESGSVDLQHHSSRWR